MRRRGGWLVVGLVVACGGAAPTERAETPAPVPVAAPPAAPARPDPVDLYLDDCGARIGHDGRPLAKDAAADAIDGCDLRPGDSPDEIAGCEPAKTACVGRCAATCDGCQSTCAATCDGCKAACAGDAACLRGCAADRARCGSSCVSPARTCHETCRGDRVLCVQAWRSKMDKACGKKLCETLLRCTEDCQRKFASIPTECKDWCELNAQ